MSRKSKVDPVEKIKTVEQMLAGEISIAEAARMIGVYRAIVRSWRDLYFSDGLSALMTQSNNKVCYLELKLQAVLEYPDGKSSQKEVGIRVKIYKTRIFIETYFYVIRHI